MVCCVTSLLKACQIDVESLKMHLEETEVLGVEAVFSFPVLQRKKPYKLANEVWVREILKEDLFTLSDTERHIEFNNRNTEASLRDLMLGTV